MTRPRSPSPSSTSGRTWRRMRGEIDAAMARVLDSGWFILGPEGEAFETELAAASRRAARVGGGQRHRGHPARAGGAGRGPRRRGGHLARSPRPSPRLAVLRAGARPVFADLDPATLNVSPEAVARALTPRTQGAAARAPLRPSRPTSTRCWSSRARAACRCVEDACQAHGARYKGRPVGALSGIGRAVASIRPRTWARSATAARCSSSDPELARAAAPAAQRRPERPLPPRGGRASTAASTRCRPRSCASSLRHLAGLDGAPPRAGRALPARSCAGAAVALPARAALRARRLPPVRGAPSAARRARARRCRSAASARSIHYPIPLHLQPRVRVAGRPAGRLPGGGEGARPRSCRCPLYPEMTDDAGAPRWPPPCGSARRARVSAGAAPCSPRPRPVLAAAVLFLVPGLRVPGPARAARSARRCALDEALFLAVAVSVAPSAWVGLRAGRSGPLLAAARGGAARAASGVAAARRGRRGRLRLPLPRPRAWRDAAARARRARAGLRPAGAAQRVPGGRPRPRRLRRGHGADRRARAASRYTDPVVLSIPRRGRGAVLPEPGAAATSPGAASWASRWSARRRAAWCPSSSTCSPPSAPTCSRPWA